VSQPHKKLKIVHTEASLGWGGQEIRVIVELREMAKRGHETILIAPPDSDIFRRGLDFHIRTLPLSMRRRDFFRNLGWLTNFFKTEKVDVVNTHSSRDSWLAGFAARRAEVPLVIKTRHISARVSRNWMTRFVYQNLHDYILTTSKGIAQDMVQYNGYDASRISSIPTGIDLARFDVKSRTLDLRKELGIPADAHLIGMVSVLRSWKGHPDFLRAAIKVKKQFPNAYFVIVGEGPRRGPIEDDLLELGLEDFVFMTGHRDEIPQILHNLDVFVLPSYANEGVPQALLQALAVGRPVVATRIGGIPEVIESGKTGFLCSTQNPEELASHIVHLLKHPEEAAEMSTRGQASVRENHSLGCMVNRLEEVYSALLNNTPPLRPEGCTSLDAERHAASLSRTRKILTKI
jgi:glycosyltransferase involved in cell wall biosynthesis